MDKQLLIDKARALEEPEDFLNLMNEIKTELLGSEMHPFSLKQLYILCNPIKDKNRYRSFEIPKKSGGIRQICVPNGNLKWFQICLNELFKALYIPSTYAMGFVTGKSIVDNARIHTNQNYVFNIDLQDFFPSIDQARVWKRLQLPPFNFNPKIAGIIAGLCAIKYLRYTDNEAFSECYVLPQGAPTSPLLTNAICDTLDRRLHGLAKRFGLHYSRYADDITFSSMHNVYKPGSDFRIELKRIITDQHFIINLSKTRLNHCSKRQEVTGLTVGQKINVTRKYVKDVRAILHIWEKYGINAAFATFYPRYKSEKCQLHRGEPNLINIISGKLCYLKMVKGEKDSIYIRLHNQFERLTQNSSPIYANRNIDYLFTMSKKDFENKLGVNIEFREREKDKKKYACFSFQDRFFVIAVSKNIDVNNLPDNLQISLTRMETPIEFYSKCEQSQSSSIPTVSRIGYLLHKPLKGYVRTQNNLDSMANVSEDLKTFVINLSETFPELHLKDDMGIIDAHREDFLLERLVKSNFDLSIL